MQHIKSILSVGIIILFLSCTGSNGGGGSSDAVDMGTITDEQSNALLYTVYAGIGYMDKSNPDDNAKLYNVMMGDLVNMLSTIMLETLAQDASATTKLINFYIYGSRQTFVHSAPGYSATLVLTSATGKSGYKGFNGALSIEFTSTGYTVGDNTYKSSTSTVDLSASTTGYFKAYYQAYPFEAGLEELLLKSVHITAADSLSATCPFGNVEYNNWEIDFDIYYGDLDPAYTSGMSSFPINVVFAPNLYLPAELGTADFRDYTVSGGITVDGDACVFNNVRYIQNQFDYSGSYTGAGQQTWILMQVNGSVAGPGMAAPAEISSLIDIGDPRGAGTIVTHMYSVSTGVWSLAWSAGELSLAATNGLVAIGFDGGTANFTGDLGIWSVPNWQEDLDPCK
jgi:hypothetical protein